MGPFFIHQASNIIEGIATVVNVANWHTDQYPLDDRQLLIVRERLVDARDRIASMIAEVDAILNTGESDFADTEVPF